MKRFTLYAAGVAFVVSATGCCCLDRPLSLENTTWELETESIQGIPAETPKPEQDITISLRDGKAFGFGGVNRYNTTATINSEAGKISFGEIASTRMAGPALPLESAYFNVLKTVDGYKIADGKLYFYADGNVVAEFDADDTPSDND